MPARIRSRCAPTEALRIVALALLLLLAAAHEAHADWDVQTFVKLRDEAQALYDRGNFDDALPRYRVLESMIEAALADNEIPEQQQPAALEGLEVVRYQIGRSQQGLDECKAALATYEALAAEAATAVIRIRVAARVPETRLCLARQALAAGDAEGGLAHALAAQNAIDTLSAPSDVAAEDAELIAAVSEAAATTVLELRAAVLARRLEAARVELGAERCDPARAATARTREVALDEPALAEVATLEREVEAMCAELERRAAADAAAAAAAAETVEIPVGPIVTLALGAAVLIGDGVFEGVVAADHVERLDQARQDCRASGTRCDEVLSLTDSLETDQIISIALLAGGGALLLGGATWWIIDASMDDGAPDAAADETSSAAGFVAPIRGGAMLGLTWRLE